MSSGAPPKANAALIFVVPWPGISTFESRGIDISTLGPLPVCSSMIESVRDPEVSSLRASLPTRRYVVPGWSSGRLPSGVSSTFETLFQAISGVATRNSSHSAIR